MSKPIKILAFTWIVITTIAILIASYALVNTQVSLKYMFEEAASLGYDHPANVDWILSAIQILKVFIGYLILNLAVVIVFVLKIKNKKLAT